jgi:hypothetical protein
MLAMLELAKLPPPRPHSSASTTIHSYGVSGSCTARPMPTAGQQQAGGGQRRPAPPAHQRHHERVEDAQRGAAQGRQRASQNSWLVL